MSVKEKPSYQIGADFSKKLTYLRKKQVLALVSKVSWAISHQHSTLMACVPVKAKNIMVSQLNPVCVHSTTFATKRKRLLVKMVS